MTYEDIRVETGTSGITTVTIDRPEAGNKFRALTARELAAALRDFAADSAQRVAVLTGTGDKFFCIGGEHDPLTRFDAASAMPIVDVYQLLDQVPKPVIAAVNGYAVGGGQVLQTMCDLSIASENAVFRQVGPMVGSFDAGYGTWYLEDTVGRKRAKEVWYLNRKYTAAEALAMGLVNEVVPVGEALPRALEVAAELMTRSPLALAALKAAFSARHSGVAGLSRITHDQLLTLYLSTEESHETSAAFAERRTPDPGKTLR
ncbi:enoyl-CoA hydratase-related protein [Blastococcus sp. SYSU D00669]